MNFYELQLKDLSFNKIILDHNYDNFIALSKYHNKIVKYAIEKGDIIILEFFVYHKYQFTDDEFYLAIDLDKKIIFDYMVDNTIHISNNVLDYISSKYKTTYLSKILD